MSDNHKTAGRYRQRLEADTAVARVCAYLHRVADWGPCRGELQAEHVIPLADAPWQKADDAWLVWACGHHNRKAAEEAAARRRGQEGDQMATASRPPKTTTGGGSKGKRGRATIVQQQPAVGERRRWMMVVGVACFVLAGIWWFNLQGVVFGHTDIALGLVMLGACAWAAWKLRGVMAGARNTKRVEVLARQREGIARALPGAVPDAVTIEPRGRGAWDARGVLVCARVHIPPAVRMDDPAFLPRLRVYLEHAVGMPLVLEPNGWQKWVGYRPLKPGERPQVAAAAPTPPTEADTQEAVRGNLEDSLQKQFKDPEIKVTVTAVSDQDASPSEIRVFYGAKFTDAKDTSRADLMAAVQAKTGERWRPDWQRPLNAVLLARRPRMPSFVPNPMWEIWETSDPHKFPIGIDEHGEIVWWDIYDAAHALIAGGTGSGKTVLLQALIWWASVQGWEIILIDPKGTGLGGLRKLPGVKIAALADPETMALALQESDDEMRRRYSLVLEGLVDDYRAFPRRLVVADEVAELVGLIGRWWTAVKVKGDPNVHPSLEAISSIPRLGRECNVLEVAGIQQAAAGFFDGTEARDNYGFRVGAGPQSRQAADMLFGRTDVGRDVPQGAKGRATFALKQGEAVEMQAFWTPTLLPNGSVKPRTDKDKGPHPDDVALIERMWEAVRRAADRREQARAKTAVKAMNRHAEGDDVTEPVERPAVTLVQPRPRRSKAEICHLRFLAVCIRQGTPRWVIDQGETVQVVAIEDDPTDDTYRLVTMRDTNGADRPPVSVPSDTVFESLAE